jgi:hypothetical protein
MATSLKRHANKDTSYTVPAKQTLADYTLNIEKSLKKLNAATRTQSIIYTLTEGIW